jgi:hypothetical protein
MTTNSRKGGGNKEVPFVQREDITGEEAKAPIDPKALEADTRCWCGHPLACWIVLLGYFTLSLLEVCTGVFYFVLLFSYSLFTQCSVCCL